MGKSTTGNGTEVPRRLVRRVDSQGVNRKWISVILQLLVEQQIIRI